MSKERQLGGLEEKIIQTEALDDSNQQEILEIKSVEDYVKDFTKAYYSMKSFRSDVHKYLQLGNFKKFKLGLLGIFSKEAYKKETNEIIRSYAIKTRADLETFISAKEELLQVKKAAEVVKTKIESLTDAQNNSALISGKYEQVITEEQNLIQQAAGKYKTDERRILEEKQRVENEIKEKTDAKKILKEKLEEHLKSSDVITRDDTGKIVGFNEERVVQKLEDIMLGEVLEDISKEGTFGFMSKIQRTYLGLVESARYDLYESGDGIEDVDWVDSYLESVKNGYRVPTYPYFIVAKPGEESKLAKGQIDTAITMDVSGSMDERNRFEIARKTTLAQHALMRKLNPQNQTYLSVFSNDFREITTLDLIKNISPVGGTYTANAINWLYKKLEKSGPSLAYLITDGYPSDFDQALKEITKFQKIPAMLRIFLIDADTDSRNYIRKLGKAAGNDTKIIEVSNYQLQNGMIKDVADALGSMQSIVNY